MLRKAPSLAPLASLVTAIALAVACGDHGTSVAPAPDGPSLAKGGRKLGEISVSVSTTGSDQDPDGYSVSVDGTASKTLPTNGSVRYPNVDVGPHTVTLSGVAANCTVDANPQSATVADKSTTNVQFAVTCAALVTTGTLTVTASTTG